MRTAIVAAAVAVMVLAGVTACGSSPDYYSQCQAAAQAYVKALEANPALPAASEPDSCKHLSIAQRQQLFGAAMVEYLKGQGQ